MFHLPSRWHASCIAALPVCLHPAQARRPRDPEQEVLRKVLREHLSTFLDSVDGSALPAHVKDELQAYLSCGAFEQGVACFTSKEYDEAAAFRRTGAGEVETIIVDDATK